MNKFNQYVPFIYTPMVFSNPKRCCRRTFRQWLMVRFGIGEKKANPMWER